MDDGAEPVWIFWRVRCVNRQTREMFDRDLFLNPGTLEEPSRSEIARIMATSDRREIVRYRPLFVEGNFKDDPTRFEVMTRRGIDGITLIGYYEDDAGNPLGEIGFMQIVTGWKDVVILGNPASVTRFGPRDMARPEKWSIAKANLLARFVEIAECLARSEFLRDGGPSFGGTVRPDGSTNITQFAHPSVFNTFAVVLLVRQLMSQGDQLFKLAVDSYLCHCSDGVRAAYVSDQRERFNGTLDRAPFLHKVANSGRDLIDLYLYGFGAVHQKDPAKESAFKAIVQQHGREAVTMESHSTLATCICGAHNVSHLIRQDLDHWVRTGQSPAPDRLGIFDLTGRLD